MSGRLRDALGAGASRIATAVTSALGTAIGDRLSKYGKKVFDDMSHSTVDNDLKNNYKRLIDQANELYSWMDDILAQTKTKFLTQECSDWISSVKEIKEEVQKLETMYNEINGRKRKLSELLNGSSESRAELSKSMAEKCKKLNELWLEGSSKIREAVGKLPQRVIIKKGSKTKDEPFFRSTVKEILGHLRDRNVKGIGLWGMAGIGKTAIMQNLNNNEDVANMFDIVIWVTVSKDRSSEKVQHEIANRLKLDMEGNTDPEEIAGQICRELKSKKYLLLLDEVWESIDLPLIGIHDSDKDSKVVLATRYRDVCHDMSTDEQIHVRELSEADALKMFKVKVGRKIKDPGIEPIANLVVNECAGFPLLLDKVARIFRRKDNIHLWRDGLKRLQECHSIESEGINELIEYLKFCYEDLNDKDKKDCFLYSAIYPEDSEIYVDYLLECWKAEEFIHGAIDFRDARRKGHHILDELIKVSFLEKSEKMKHVRMNKILRNMALNIYSQGLTFKILVKPNERLLEAPNEVEWQHANIISLMDNNLSTLPQMPHCSELSTLLLQKNQDLTVIPNSFFDFMQKLRVLDLHGTGITSLPLSISCLKCLRALYLNSCINLMELCCLEGLEHLEVLDIRDTGINHFPNLIGRLRELKCLRMSLSNFGIENSSNVEFCQNVLFSRLSFLEELLIDLDTNNRSWEAILRAIITELATLTRLSSLSICFPTVDCLQSFISTSPLWKDSCFSFQFSIGYHDSARYQILDCFEYEFMNYLKFTNGDGLAVPIISEVLLKTHAFELIGHKGVSRFSDFGIESINMMRGFVIEGCNDIKTIVDTNDIKRSALELLEKMFINDVSKLESIWEGPVHDGSLSKLTTINLCKCLKLKKIFSSGMIEQLSLLRHLEVKKCPEIEEIITESENNGLNPGALPRLKILVLSDLQSLRSIWIDDSLKWPSLERIKISMCQMLTRLPFNIKNANNLSYIGADQSWWNALEWQDDAIKQRLQSIWSHSPL